MLRIVFANSSSTPAPSVVVLLTILLLLTAAPVGAQTRYVGDNFDVTVRTGSDISHRVVKILHTGDKLEVLEKAENGWSRIRTDKGVEGWVLTRYLADNPPARQRLEAAVQAQAEAEAERDRLKEALLKSQEQIGRLETAQAELERVRKLSANALNLERENQLLKARLQTLEKEAATARQQLESAEEKDGTRFFLAGAGVLLLGLIGGSLLSSRPQKRNMFT